MEKLNVISRTEDKIVCQRCKRSPEEYHLVYKCRLCGKKYEVGAIRVNSMKLTKAACDLNSKSVTRINPSDGFVVAKTEPHDCEDGSIGMADFCGFYKEKRPQMLQGGS